MESGDVDSALPDASCVYALYPGRAGSYLISASAPGWVMVNPPSSVTLAFGSCGYEGETRNVVIAMMAN
jgi:hypothetical protein